MDFLSVISSFGNNWVAQELIEQSEDLSRINSTSLNTFRVMTYVCEGKICLCPIALRMGRARRIETIYILEEFLLVSIVMER